MSPGDKLRCLEGCINPSMGVPPLVRGKIYTLAAIRGGYAELVEMPEVAWRLNRFGPPDDAHMRDIRGTISHDETRPEVTDHAEERCWRKMRRICTDNACASCGAPLPCAYHA
jgi:hypothetical protein